MLRHALVATLALGLVASPAVARPGARTATAEYTGTVGVAGVITGDTDVNGTHYGSAVVFTRRGESRIEITVKDDTGLPVAFEITQDTNGDGVADWKTDGFCGRTPAPVRLAKQRADVIVLINAGQCGDGVSAPTTGTVTARLA